MSIEQPAENTSQLPIPGDSPESTAWLNIDATETHLRETQCILLGMTVTQLALKHNGLGNPDQDVPRLTAQARQLLGELGLDPKTIFTASAPPRQQIEAEIDEAKLALAARITQLAQEQGLSLREIAARTPLSHMTIKAVKAGRGSLKATRAVAQALGIEL